MAKQKASVGAVQRVTVQVPEGYELRVVPEGGYQEPIRAAKEAAEKGAEERAKPAPNQGLETLDPDRLNDMLWRLLPIDTILNLGRKFAAARGLRGRVGASDGCVIIAGKKMVTLGVYDILRYLNENSSKCPPATNGRVVRKIRKDRLVYTSA